MPERALPYARPPDPARAARLGRARSRPSARVPTHPGGRALRNSPGRPRASRAGRAQTSCARSCGPRRARSASGASARPRDGVARGRGRPRCAPRPPREPNGLSPLRDRIKAGPACSGPPPRGPQGGPRLRREDLSRRAERALDHVKSTAAAANGRARAWSEWSPRGQSRSLKADDQRRAPTTLVGTQPPHRARWRARRCGGLPTVRTRLQNGTDPGRVERGGTSQARHATRNRSSTPGRVRALL